MYHDREIGGRHLQKDFQTHMDNSMTVIALILRLVAESQQYTTASEVATMKYVGIMQFHRQAYF